jgi:hypothetical protein
MATTTQTEPKGMVHLAQNTRHTHSLWIFVLETTTNLMAQHLEQPAELDLPDGFYQQDYSTKNQRASLSILLITTAQHP